MLNVYVDTKKDCIYVVDYKWIRKYNLQGEFIKQSEIKLPWGSMIVDTDDNLLVVGRQFFCNEDRNLLYKLNENFDLLSVCKSRNQKVYKHIKQGIFDCIPPSIINGRIHIQEPLADTLYCLRDDKLLPIWEIDYGGLRCSDETLISAEITEKIAKTKITNFRLRESDKYFIIDYEYNLFAYNALYDKTLGEYKFFHKKSLFDETRSGFEIKVLNEPCVVWPEYIKNNVFASIINIDNLSEKLREKLKCNLDDNPILILGEF